MLYQLMAKLILNDDLVLDYGFPQACMCCGNDDITQLKHGQSKISKSLIPLGQVLLIFLMRKSRTSTLDVPYEDYPALYQRHLDNAILYE